VASTITMEELDFIVERANITVTPEQKADIIEAYPYIAAMIELVHRPRSLMAEPAHIFVPGEAVQP
jgi:hypothetical protein